MAPVGPAALGLQGGHPRNVFSSHKERKDCGTENPPAVAEVSGVLVGSADA